VNTPERAQEPGDEGAASGGTQFGIGKSILFSAILLVAFFGTIELGLRAWVFFFRAGYERFDLATQTFELVPGSYPGRIRINSQGFVGAELQPDAPDLWRIYALGDSCTFGGGNETETYAAMLQRRLGEKDPGTGLRYEVVNGGVQGLNSELALNRFRAKAPLVRPEIVTIYVGWNDLMKVDPAGQGSSDRLAGVARALDSLWIVKGLRKLVFFNLRPKLYPPRTGPESETGRFRGFEPSIYERNLREIVGAVREMHARPVLLTLPTVVRRDMTADDLRASGVVFPYFPGANAVGDFLDLLEAYNRTIRRVAAEEHVPLVDIARTFAAMPDVRPYFYDTMHPEMSGREVIAGELDRALRQGGLLSPDAATGAAVSGATP
jgi:lysophospholipase L1-like esterase